MAATVNSDYNRDASDAFLARLGDDDVEAAASSMCLRRIQEEAAARKSSVSTPHVQSRPRVVTDEGGRVAVFHRHLKNGDFPAFAEAFARAKALPSEEQPNLAQLWIFNHGISDVAKDSRVAELILTDASLLREIDNKLRLVVVKRLFETYEPREGFVAQMLEGAISPNQIINLLASKDVSEETIYEALDHPRLRTLLKNDQEALDTLYANLQRVGTVSRWLRFARRRQLKNTEIAEFLLNLQPDAQAATRLLARRTGFLKHLPHALRLQVAQHLFGRFVPPPGWVRLARKCGLSDAETAMLYTQRCYHLAAGYLCGDAEDIEFLDGLLAPAVDERYALRTILTNRQLQTVVHAIVKRLPLDRERQQRFADLSGETRRRRYSNL